MLVVDAKGKTERRSPEKDMADKAPKHPTAYDPARGVRPAAGAVAARDRPAAAAAAGPPPVGGPRRPVRPPPSPTGGVSSAGRNRA